MSQNQQLTSVKVDKDIFEAFKIETIKTKFSLQKLADRCMHLYLTDPEFQKMVRYRIIPLARSTQTRGLAALKKRLLPVRKSGIAVS